MEHVTILPDIPDTYTRVFFEGQPWESGPGFTGWHPCERFSDTIGEPGATEWRTR